MATKLSNPKLVILLSSAGTFMGFLFCIVTLNEWLLLEKFRQEGVPTLAKVRGIRTEKAVRTQSSYLQVRFSTSSHLVNFGETVFSISNPSYQKDDTISILYLPKEPDRVIRKIDLPSKYAYLPFLLALIFTLLCLFLLVFTIKK